MQIENNHPHKGRVHRILVHSYSFYLITFLLALALDSLSPSLVLKNSSSASLGLLFLVLATLLISWAQYTTRNDLDKNNMTKDTFCRGPYCFTRSPTNWGLFLLMLGFGLITGGFFMIVFALASFVLTKYLFIKKQEAVLVEKYGAPYLEYKKSVKL